MSLWNPSNMSSTLTMWFKADTLTAHHSDGDTVASWTNQAIAQNVAQATESRKPTFQTDELGGKPVVRFDGTNDILSDGAVSDLNVDTGDVWFATLGKMTNTSAVGFMWEKGATQLGLMNTKTGILAFRLGGTTNIPGMDSGNWSRTDFFITTAKRATGSCTAFYNGSAADTTGTTNTGSIDNTNVFDIGATTVGGNSMNGDVAEILVGGGSATRGELQQVEGYFARKYSMSVLPSTHKYKDFAPAFGLVGTHNNDIQGEISLNISGSIASDGPAAVI
jgi:hypothetical protein